MMKKNRTDFGTFNVDKTIPDAMGMDKPEAYETKEECENWHNYKDKTNPIPSRPNYPSEDLKQIENLLIKLISGTTHATGLATLTTALCEVRKCHKYLDGAFFYGET